MTAHEPCAGQSVLRDITLPVCTRPGGTLLVYVCRFGHEGVVRACDQHALRAMLGQDATPFTVCPTCRQPAWLAIYCSPCRLSDHQHCAAQEGAGRALAGLPPRRAAEYCACSCDPSAPRVPGAGWAREHVEADGGEP